MDIKFVRRQVMWRWDGEEGKHILVGVPKTKSANMFNPVSAVIFSLCDGKHSVEDIVKTLEARYPEARRRIRSDVLGFIEHLKDLDLVCRVE